MQFWTQITERYSSRAVQGAGATQDTRTRSTRPSAWTLAGPRTPQPHQERSGGSGATALRFLGLPAPKTTTGPAGLKLTSVPPAEAEATAAPQPPPGGSEARGRKGDRRASRRRLPPRSWIQHLPRPGMRHLNKVHTDRVESTYSISRKIPAWLAWLSGQCWPSY